MTGIEYLVGAFGLVVTMIVAAAIFSYFEIERHADQHERGAAPGAAPPAPSDGRGRRSQ